MSIALTGAIFLTLLTDVTMAKMTYGDDDDHDIDNNDIDADVIARADGFDTDAHHIGPAD